MLMGQATLHTVPKVFWTQAKDARFIMRNLLYAYGLRHRQVGWLSTQSLIGGA